MGRDPFTQSDQESSGHSNISGRYPLTDSYIPYDTHPYRAQYTVLAA